MELLFVVRPHKLAQGFALTFIAIKKSLINLGVQFLKRHITTIQQSLQALRPQPFEGAGSFFKPIKHLRIR